MVILIVFFSMSRMELYILSQKGNNKTNGGGFMTTNWKQKEKKALLHQQNLVHYYAKTFNLEPFIVQLLFERTNLSEEQLSSFLFPSAHQLHSPFLLNDMKKAVKRIIEAIKRKEPIVVFGDYDVDGMTSCALLGKALRYFGAKVEMVLPLRSEGYGLSVSFIEKVKHTIKPSLIITVDNGSSSGEAVRLAQSYGIDVIVTDHHEVLGEHPPAVAFINPKRTDSFYPFDGLSGAGVAFKLVQALFEACNQSWLFHMWDYLELACLGTVADMMVLTGENRVIASLGIQKMNNQPSLFFNELKKQLYLSEITSSDISFRIAPVLNSSGRIDNPNEVVRLLSATNLHQHEIQSLFAIDKIRKQKTESQFQQIQQQIEAEGLAHQPIIVVHGEYEEGIMGILAAKITNCYHKPAIVISSEGKASCRGGANPHFSMIQTIEKAQDFLLGYGGHQQAAGFSIEPKHVPDFRQFVQTQTLHIPPYQHTLWYDAILPMQTFPRSLWDELSLLEPFGMGNPKPVFFSPNTRIESVHYFGVQKQYFKCRVGSYETLSFQKADAMRDFEARQYVDFLYTMGNNHQFLIEDVSIEETRNHFLHAI